MQSDVSFAQKDPQISDEQVLQHGHILDKAPRV